MDYSIPFWQSYSLNSKEPIVDFPQPLEPTIAYTDPAGIERLKSDKTGTPERLGYANVMLLNSISPFKAGNVIPPK